MIVISIQKCLKKYFESHKKKIILEFERRTEKKTLTTKKKIQKRKKLSDESEETEETIFISSKDTKIYTFYVINNSLILAGRPACFCNPKRRFCKRVTVLTQKNLQKTYKNKSVGGLFHSPYQSLLALLSICRFFYNKLTNQKFTKAIYLKTMFLLTYQTAACKNNNKNITFLGFQSVIIAYK